MHYNTQGMLDLEELPASTAKEDYILNMARSLLQEGMQWQLTAIRQGFRCGLGT